MSRRPLSEQLNLLTQWLGGLFPQAASPKRTMGRQVGRKPLRRMTQRHLLPLFSPLAQGSAPADSTSPSPLVEVQHTTGLKQANARLRAQKGQEGHVVGLIKVPAHWPASAKQQAVQQLQKALQRQWQQVPPMASSPHATEEPTLALHTAEQLEAYVRALNAATFKAPLQGVKVGRAKYSQLGQLNVRTGVITISRYCLGEAIPAEAFRYLIVHELAHFIEANHSHRFWALVAQHCPGYKQQRQAMRVYHQHQVWQHTTSTAGWQQAKPLPAPTSSS